MRRLFPLLAAAAIACTHATAVPPPPAFEHLDECPNPVMESMSWVLVEGTIAAVGVDGTLELEPHRTVHLVSVAADTPAAREYLRSLIGKRAKVFVSMSKFQDETISGAVEVGNEDVTRTLLARGLAHYVRPAPYTVSSYTDCLYRIAEREAGRRR